MQATDILSQEHRVIERVLDALQSAARSAEAGGEIAPEFFIEASDFIRGFADGCHHHKEEGVLFKMMAENGVPVQGGPLGVMLQEHELGRQFTRAMRVAAEQWKSGDESARKQVAQNALGYVALLRQHIIKEDNILFPMADRAISPDEYSVVWAGFEHIEHQETGEGIHEKYLALADKLTTQAASLQNIV
jgi:hemerythrin-like domain-containing protein